jgi:Holliday junction resolvase
VNSRAKGKRGELEFAEYLRSRGFTARRGQQFSGGGDSPDVVSSLPGVHIEVKRRETGNLYGWLSQAVADAKVGTIPIVFHRRNNEEWVAILRAEDMISLLKGKPDDQAT